MSITEPPLAGPPFAGPPLPAAAGSGVLAGDAGWWNEPTVWLALGLTVLLGGRVFGARSRVGDRRP
ncbi:MAG: hypothetical protein O3A76_14540 [Chloroflexi bacterium]|nr:hypothetical protein [Chloroflexota bacterium]